MSEAKPSQRSPGVSGPGRKRAAVVSSVARGSVVTKGLFALGMVGLLSSTVYAGMVCVGVARFTAHRRRRRALAAARQGAGEALPSVSLLKPLHGAELELPARLATFFEQDYPDYEILFCAREADDAGLTIARAVAERYPAVPVKVLALDAPARVNAKVSSLERMEREAAHELLVISDSDVRVTPGYLREIVADFADPAVGASTCLYRGVASWGVWGALEACGMSVEMTGGVMAASLLEEMGFLLGPTMTVRRAAVRAMGGFGVLGEYCSDDFLLGHEIARLGYRVVLSTHVIDHMVLNLSFWTSIKHQVRWMKSTRFSRPKGHFGTGLTFGVPFGLLAGGAAWALGWLGLAAGLLGWSLVIRMGLAAVVGGVAVRDTRLGRTVCLYPLRDLMGFLFWVASYASGTVLWRGQAYQLGEQGRMRLVE